MERITQTQRAAALLLLAFALVAVHACAPRCGDLTSRAETAIDGGDFRLTPPPAAGLADVEKALDAVIPGLLTAGDVPGAVVFVGRQVDRGYQVWQKAYGYAQIEPERLPMPVDAIFDLASLTKPIATGTSLMLLVERGKVRLDDRVGDYLPEFREGTTRDVTIRQLMMHDSGLPPYLDLTERKRIISEAGFPCPDQTRAAIRAVDLRNAPGERFTYSCLNAICCAEIVEAVTGQSLDQFVAVQVFRPLGMTDTGFVPPPDRRARCVPTTVADRARGTGHFLRGEVHDPLAAMQGGVSGNAGLFSTAADLSRFAQMLLNDGELDNVRILRPETVDKLLRPPVANASRGLLWDLYNEDDSSAPLAVGHTGYTGTALRLYPNHGAYVILLTNRVHPDDHGRVKRLRAATWRTVEHVLDMRRAPIAEVADEPAGGVLTGIDVALRNGFEQLTGRKIGLITNHTGLDRLGRSTIELLSAAANLELAALFSPEHGLKGALDARVADSTDPLTGLKVYSLYGKTRRPTREMLDGLDTLVFDIQDIGTRFYTYISTMGLAMEAAAEHGLRFVVLDRPNPITGRRIFGPLNDKTGLFTAYHSIPIVHGMTIGELARMFNAERDIGVDLQVVQLEGWRRNMWLDETLLMWVDPSPNMRSLTQATLYPAIGLIEACDVSVGRGTDTPFERLGAPWIDGRRLAARLNGLGLEGIRFLPYRFTPSASKHTGKACGGVQIVLVDRDAFDPIETGLSIVRELKDLFGGAFDVNRVNRLLVNEALLERVTATTGPTVYSHLWQKSMAEFKVRRQRFLLYD